MFSFKNIYTPNINCSNLLFITGPTKCGKSYFLEQNLEVFVQNKSAVSFLYIVLEIILF
jgi:predicted AAA+ superfamily ATPase